MLRALAHPRLRVVALLAAVLWVWSTVAGRVHAVRVLHVVCEEHHEVVEVGGHAGQSDGPGWYAASAHGDHDHGCALEPLPSIQSASVPNARPVHLRWRPLPAAAPVAPPARGPPLDYAPKTSPPRIA